MYDLRRYGIPDGQIVIGANLTSTNWNPSGPDGLYLSEASYYQTFFDKRVEIKLGLIQNSVEFLGVQVGGSLANGVFGPNASLFVENGLDSSGAPTPGANVKVSLPDNFYTKLGLQRAISPDGTLTERLQNPTGANFKVSNAGLFVIDEWGYRVNAKPGQASTWIRAAANYTSSRYTQLLNAPTRDSPNFGLYGLADRQILQTAPMPVPAPPPRVSMSAPRSCTRHRISTGSVNTMRRASMASAWFLAVRTIWPALSPHATSSAKTL